MKKAGISMIELLIVISILALLIIMSLLMLPRQLEKVRDGQRKSDLQKIKIAFEHYYNDNGCYPSAAVLENCRGINPPVHELSPYLQDIPCDPLDESYYLYAPFDISGGEGTCNGYRVWADLEENFDPEIGDLNCNGATACGASSIFEVSLGDDSWDYNYGISEGVPVLYGEFIPVENAEIQSGEFCCGGVCNVWDTNQGYCSDGPYASYQECVDMSACDS